ncbi:pilus assembly protein TadE [Nocardioides zeae]|uniref:Pilus assembly protein TadE n=1 Tax=Nocardioides imazamoxiresistens TaxID=3231893 RepID=A0ABU3Q0B7_9ACTN|nr:pilus assembly protein TadG-related protein [Nocardioides zeae]MDT9594886.1 pilus assembly protein TadE [Nocardioides zeae]
MRSRRATNAADQRGIALLWTTYLGVALLAVAALVLDGGYTLAAKREAMNHAEQAARAGADALDEAALRNGATLVGPDAAAAAAQTYLAQAGATGTVQVAGGVVTVTVSGTRDTLLLSAIGVNSMDFQAEASALSIDAEG